MLVDLAEIWGGHDQKFTLAPFLCILLSTHQNYFAYQYVIHELLGRSLFLPIIQLYKEWNLLYKNVDNSFAT